MTSRAASETLKFSTPFGNCYLHCGRDVAGNIVSIGLSHPWKEPDAQVSLLVEAIGGALRDLCEGPP